MSSVRQDALDRGWPAVAARRARHSGSPRRTGSRFPRLAGAVAVGRGRRPRRFACRSPCGSPSPRSRSAPPGSGGVVSGCTSSTGASSPPGSASRPARRWSSPARRADRRSPFGSPPRFAASTASALRERVLLELPAGRAPPQGAVLELRARPVAPRGPETGFDERGWLARRGDPRRPPCERLLADRRPAGRDRRRRRPAAHGDRERACARNRPASGARSSSVSCSVPTRESTRSSATRSRRRVSITCSPSRVRTSSSSASVSSDSPTSPGSGGRSAIRSRSLRSSAYALAVGWQPSVVRAAVAGCLASVAWLLSRPSDRWHTMAVGAVVLLAWTPRSLLEPGFQLSFAAVAAIFLTMPRLRRLQRGLPGAVEHRRGVGISAACGVATAPILWLQFGTIPLWTVPANALAEPAMPVLLGCGLGAAVLAPVIPAAAVALSWLAGAAAAWIAFSARLIASLPYAQTSSRTVVLALVGALAAAVVLRALPRYRRRQAVTAAVVLVPLARCSAGGRRIHLPRGRRRRACGSRSSMSGRGTGSCSRRRRARCSSTPGRRRPASTGSCDGWACTRSPRS